MQHIIVSDIFGKTKALETIADSLSREVKIFDPYSRESSEALNFDTEKQAYEYFVTEVGLQKYSDNLENYISEFDEQVSLLGFSVGASTIWKISESIETSNISGATCFYGSQIRHYKEISPKFPIQLVLPSFEEHFSIPELKAELSLVKNVSIHQSAYLHGFMNQYSENFNQLGYDQYLQDLCNIQYDQEFQTTTFTG